MSAGAPVLLEALGEPQHVSLLHDSSAGDDASDDDAAPPPAERLSSKARRQG
jgi:hypothetical protein